jgi:uncharacterized protein (TIGR03435 family)
MTFGPALYTVMSCLSHEVQGEGHVTLFFNSPVLFGTVSRIRSIMCVMNCGALFIAGTLGVSSICLIAQSQPAPAHFDAAAVKLATAPAPGRAAKAMGMAARIETSPGRLSVRTATLQDLIDAAYGIEDYQVSGGSDWVKSERFAVEAKSAEPASKEQLLLMLQPLLTERFQLSFHRETQQVAVYALTVSKNGPKFQRTKPGGEPARIKVNYMGRNVDLPWLARFLTRFGSDKPVIDKTGLVGNFDLDLDMERILTPAAEAAGGNPNSEAIFDQMANALNDQLGLKLVATKASIEVLVIDRAERPSQN